MKIELQYQASLSAEMVIIIMDGDDDHSLLFVASSQVSKCPREL